MLLDLDDPDATLLEDASTEDLRLHLVQLRRQLWDEEHFTDNLCRKLSQLQPSERSSLAFLLGESKGRQRQLGKLVVRVQAILDEKPYTRDPHQ